MVDAVAELFQFPALIARLARDAAIFEADAFRTAAGSANARAAAIAIAFLAGVSEMLGQSVVLVINRVPLYRFLASLAFTGASYVATALVWGVSAYLCAPLTPVGALAAADIAVMTSVLALAFAPRLLGVFSIAPYLGAAISNALEVWAMALAIFALREGLDLPLGAAAFCGVAGWTASYYFRMVVGHALRHPLARMRVFVSGSLLESSPQRIMDDLMRKLQDGDRS